MLFKAIVMVLKPDEKHVTCQLSKRALLVTTEPTYQLRLDLIKNDGKAVGNGDQEGVPTENIASYNLQCDYANLKNIQNELQKAIDAYTGVHSQRITRYIAQMVISKP